jgi:aerobic-type carbon monoxide dehydrogenase small subunit (CoxS/CutS family)
LNDRGRRVDVVTPLILVLRDVLCMTGTKFQMRHAAQRTVHLGGRALDYQCGYRPSGQTISA